LSTRCILGGTCTHVIHRTPPPGHTHLVCLQVGLCAGQRGIGTGSGGVRHTREFATSFPWALSGSPQWLSQACHCGTCKPIHSFIPIHSFHEPDQAENGDGQHNTAVHLPGRHTHSSCLVLGDLVGHVAIAQLRVSTGHWHWHMHMHSMLCMCLSPPLCAHSIWPMSCWCIRVRATQAVEGGTALSRNAFIAEAVFDSFGAAWWLCGALVLSA
jgi:hypothetical protein